MTSLVQLRNRMKYTSFGSPDRGGGHNIELAT